MMQGGFSHYRIDLCYGMHGNTQVCKLYSKKKRRYLSRLKDFVLKRSFMFLFYNWAPLVDVAKYLFCPPDATICACDNLRELRAAATNKTWLSLGTWEFAWASSETHGTTGTTSSTFQMKGERFRSPIWKSFFSIMKLFEYHFWNYPGHVPDQDYFDRAWRHHPTQITL